MPTYEYLCRDCGHSFDAVQSMSDQPLAICPVCGGALRKVFAAPAISFKGSGFYATDQRKKGGERPGEPGDKEKPGDKETPGDSEKPGDKERKETGAKQPAASSSEPSSSSKPSESKAATAGTSSSNGEKGSS